ncbi:IS200/IS605 family transposase [Candidatus Bathyarchaeota archaeon]|nr:IS200/IS605 family transposase [Candidatus Bathyarchaeota archaeon]
MPRGYLRSETSVHLMTYHFVWCPKYRRKVLENKIGERLRGLLEAKTQELKCKILSLEIMPDHVHIFLEAPPTLSPNSIVAALKGYSSRVLRSEFPELRSRLPTLWSRSYFASTHGNASSEIIQKYIEEQARA